MLRGIRLWFHYSLVALCWLALVPLVSYRTYRCLFSGSLSALLSVPYDSFETIFGDCIKGSLIVMASFCLILSLVWLREQIINGGGPEWLENIAEELQAEVMSGN